MNRKTLLSILILLIVSGSILLNIYLVLKNNELNGRVNAFIPAAMSLEDENKRLQEKERMQQELLDACAYSKDSLQKVQAKVAPQSLVPDPGQQNIPIEPTLQNPTGGTLKDLNKGIQ